MEISKKILIRKEIQENINDFFGTKIEIDERAIQVLSFSSNSHSAPNSRHILSSALLLYPSLHEKFEESGLILRRTLLPTIQSIESQFVMGGWQASMRSCFSLGDNSERLCSSGYRVRDTGKLQIEDLILGPIEAESISEKFSDISRHTLWIMSNEKEYVVSHKENAESFWASTSEKRLRFYGGLSKNLQDIIEIDQSAGSQQFVFEWDGHNFRFRPFGVYGGYKLQESPLPDGSLWIARGNVIQPSTVFSEEAISELEFLINKGALEKDFQSFFEANPEFILALGDYTYLHPQIVLTEDAGSKLIPDFFLEKMNSDFCDICDLKRPTAQLARYQKYRLRFRDAINEAVAQMEHYRDWFEDRGNREQFYGTYGLHAYRPKVIVIIGRKHNFYDELDRIRLESRLPSHISLRTYDDVVDKARQWLSLASLHQQRSFITRISDIV